MIPVAPLDELNVLVSSAGRRGALIGLIRHALDWSSLSGRVAACDRSPLSPAGRLADESFLVPDCRSPEFVEAILALCRTHNIGLVVPTIDAELSVYARARERFANEGVKVLCSGDETVEITSDKRRTADWLARHGHPTMRTADASKAVADSRTWPLPLFAKPAGGSGSIGARVLTSERELAQAASEPELIVQELASGTEYTMDVWVDPDGSGATSVVARQRLEVRGGEVVKAVTRSIPELEDACRALVDDLPDALGPLTIQAFRDAEDLRLIEINPRLGGGYPLSYEAGARTLDWALAWALGRPPEPISFDWLADLVMLRYDDAVFVPEHKLQ